MKEPMRCYVASVNRTLSVLAALWVLVPMVGLVTGMKLVPGDEEELQALQRPGHEQASPAEAQGSNDPCQLGEEQGLLATLCLATAHPNRKKARVTLGR